MELKVYGCRGSNAVHHISSKFGGNASCIAVWSDDDYVILDAGSGLIVLESELRKKYASYPIMPKPLNIILSHLHLDHISGLPTLESVWTSESYVNIFTPSRDERPLVEQVFGVFSPPYWPAPIAEITSAKCTEIRLGKPFQIGRFTVTAMNSSHPNSTASYRITDGKKTLVHLLDGETSTMDAVSYSALVEFCRDADMVVFDAAYSPEDYPSKVGYGHSTVLDGMNLADKCNCKQMLFCHFSFHYEDAEMDRWHGFLKDTANTKFIMAYDGLKIPV